MTSPNSHRTIIIMKMKKLILGLSILLGTTPAWCAPVETASPDGKLRVSTDIIGGKPVYSVSYNGKTILENSLKWPTERSWI